MCKIILTLAGVDGWDRVVFKGDNGRFYKTTELAPDDGFTSLSDDDKLMLLNQIKEAIRKHDAERPFAPEKGQPLKFKPGDKVTYTNDYGISFEFHITAYYKLEEPCCLYACGARYLLDWDCHWVPVKEANLALAQ